MPKPSSWSATAAAFVLAGLLATAGSTGTARANPEDPLAPGEPAFACKKPPAGARVTVTFAGKTALTDLATWLYAITCQPIMFSAELGDRPIEVTMIGGSSMTVKEAGALFRNAVEAAGLVVRDKRSALLVLPDPKAPRSCPTDPLAELHKAMDAGIVVIDETHVRMTRTLLKELLDKPDLSAKGARLVPDSKNGKTVGFKLYAIRPRSIYDRLGLRNGDLVTAWNGTQLDAADKLLEMYAGALKGSTLQLSITRRGAPTSLTIDLID